MSNYRILKVLQRYGGEGIMTKEELLEDVLIGGIVKIYTESDETFEGTVTDFGESGLKITLLNSNMTLIEFFL